MARQVCSKDAGPSSSQGGGSARTGQGGRCQAQAQLQYSSGRDQGFKSLSKQGEAHLLSSHYFCVFPAVWSRVTWLHHIRENFEQGQLNPWEGYYEVEKDEYEENSSGQLDSAPLKALRKRTA